ncbi:hypothetical protein U3516DRAFT_759870 [Neocallimastix sp. 'constans']
MEKNLEIEISKTNREKEQIILNRKISLIFHPKGKTIQKKKKIYMYINDDSHNHIENKFGAAKSIVWVLYVQGYNSIKSQVTRSRRKQLPPDITTFDEIPIES